ncbi:MAG: type II secretory pathway, component PulD [Opitutus sp.]|nr:type II secretory pathway, component PulD [Opitutus sp.]
MPGTPQRHHPHNITMAKRSPRPLTCKGTCASTFQLAAPDATAHRPPRTPRRPRHPFLRFPVPGLGILPANRSSPAACLARAVPLKSPPATFRRRPRQMGDNTRPTPFCMKQFFACLARIALGAFVMSAALVRLPAQPQTPPPALAPGASLGAPGNAAIGPLQLRDESIDQVLALIERWTGKTLLRPQALPSATITVNLRDTVTKEEAIRALETLLNLNGVALTPLGDRFIKVTALNLAKGEAPELIEGSTLELAPSGRLASKIFSLNFLRVAEFMPQVTQLLSPNTGSPPIIFEKANAALVTDTLSNLQRIETLIARLDQPALGGMTPKFYTLSFAKASDVVNKMRTILSGALQSQLGTATSFNADDRTNQVIVISDPRQVPFFDDLIAKLDVKSDPNTRNEVIYLKHAASKDVASILSQLVSGQNNAARAAEGSARPTLGAPMQTNVVQGPNNPPVSAPAAITLPTGISIEPSNQFSTLLTILPEERSNSIVVSGTVDDIRLIHELVDKIDVLLAQVRIEVVIAEVTLSDNAQSGIAALGLKIEGDKLVGAQISGPGFEATEITGTRQPTGDIDLAALISITTTPRKSNATILSQPNIITTHNKEGSIFVGEQRPVISSYLNDQTTTPGTIGSGYRSTVSSKDIGISLKVKPLIGNDGSVQLEITQEVNDILGDITIDGNPQPRIGRRSTNSFVSVKSGDIIVLGGLQRTTKSKSTSRLGPIPIIGDLLGARSRENTRTDLVFFLRPTVLTNSPVDNVPAMEQVESLPEEQRNRVKRALQVPGTTIPPTPNSK